MTQEERDRLKEFFSEQIDKARTISLLFTDEAGETHTKVSGMIGDVSMHSHNLQGTVLGGLSSARQAKDEVPV